MSCEASIKRCHRDSSEDRFQNCAGVYNVVDSVLGDSVHCLIYHPRSVNRPSQVTAEVEESVGCTGLGPCSPPDELSFLVLGVARERASCSQTPSPSPSPQCCTLSSTSSANPSPSSTPYGSWKHSTVSTTTCSVYARDGRCTSIRNQGQ